MPPELLEYKVAGLDFFSLPVGYCGYVIDDTQEGLDAEVLTLPPVYEEWRWN
jgi:hypothetical protein